MYCTFLCTVQFAKKEKNTSRLTKQLITDIAFTTVINYLVALVEVVTIRYFARDGIDKDNAKTGEI